MLAAFEAALKQSSKDEAAWKRTYQGLTAEPKEVRAERMAAAKAARDRGEAAPQAPGRMSVDEAEAMLARFAATDAMYGAA